jgi:hypothetical protein
MSHQPFKPVEDKALLEKVLQELLSSCEEEVAEEAAAAQKSTASVEQEQAARAGAARWQQAMGQPTTMAPTPGPKPAGARSLLDVRLPPKKK